MQCKDKKKYPTEIDALSSGAYYLKKRPGMLRAYQCLECKKWHLTSKKKHEKSPKET